MKQKPKLLLVGWEHKTWNFMKRKELAPIKDLVEIRFAEYDTSALDEIAKAWYRENRQIDFILFKRSFLYKQSREANLIAKFFEYHTQFFNTAFGMIESDTDSVKKLVSAIDEFIFSNDWEYLQALIEARIAEKERDDYKQKGCFAFDKLNNGLYPLFFKLKSQH